jgi:uncharacterized repeat protein (TIGR01451 family)
VANLSRLSTLRFTILAALLALGGSAHAAMFTTYAAWSDAGNNQQGHMYIYTGPSATTDVYLYNATTPNTTMAALYCNFPVTAVGPYQPVTEVGSCPYPSATGFGNNYFMCQATNPIIWEVEEPIYSSEADSHDFLAAADTNNYIGTVFMTYMRGDKTPGGTSGLSSPSRLATDYGDQAAIFNPGSTAITVTVRKWTGTPPAGSWGATLITSPSIPPLGVWMYGPSDTGTHDRGGTLLAAQGHYRFDVTGGTGMLYKGNTFSPYAAPGNRDNMVHFGPDINTGFKVGTDLFGAVVTDGGAPHIVINNQGAATANYSILQFVPALPGYYCAGCGIAGGNEYVWPVNGNNPSGTWTVVSSGTIPALSSAFYDAGALTNAGFYRVQSTNGQPLSAEFGSAILQQTWCDGDYMYANDTRLAFGRSFNFGGKFFSSQVAGDPVQLHIVAPLAGTTVHVWVNGTVSGPNFYNSTQSTTVPNAGLAFPFPMPGSSYEYWDGHITSNNIIYAYVMSTTDGSTKGGETFFSVPPPINPLVVVSKTVNKSTATLGDTLTYSLIAQNPGSQNVTNAQVWDTLPAGVSFISSTPAPTISSSPFFEWDLGTITPTAQSIVSVVAIVTAGTQLEVKHNTATAQSYLTQAFQSNDAPVTILIPGANLKKTVSKTQAMPGDTLTYVLSYTNTTPPPPSTPALDLQVESGTKNSNDLDNIFSVTNYSGASININDLMICEWVSNSSPASAVQFTENYGGGTSPYVWNAPTLVGSATAWSPSQTLPSNRQANIELCIHATSGQLLANGSTWNGIAERIYLNSPQAWDNHLDDYSGVTTTTSYVQDHHFALYYQGNLVTEYTSPTTPDPETGIEPSYLWMEDFVPSPLTYQGSTPSASVSLPQLTWSLDSVARGGTVNFTWTGVIPGGTAPGTVIDNEADYSTATGPGLSNKVSTLVGSANLSLVKSINKNVFAFGETVTYCIAWSNTGTAAVNVTITDPYDPVLTFVGADNGGTNSGHTMTWNLGSQAANSSGTVCFWAKITAYPSLPTPWAPESPLFSALDPAEWRQTLARYGEPRREPWWTD